MNPDDSAAAFEFGSTEPLAVDVPGMRIGDYVLIQLIGEGSYGHVWKAKEQGAVTRDVAIKILRRSLRNPEIEARFLQEVQVLIDLARHPGIATLYSTGRTTDGRLYFAMELVPGAPITTFCDDRKLTLRQRLDLFRQVCDAVHYAHSINIVHRDIKPSNILAGVRPGAVGDPDTYFIKLIDFGIAKVSGGRLISAAIATDLNQAVGTVGYMAPEQARPGLAGVDLRSDVYSLGVVLYELLVGLTPFTRNQIIQAMSSGLLEFLKSVDPPLPSTRLLGRNSASGDATEPETSAIAEARRDKIQSLLSTLRGDLSFIPLHAMRKQPSDRYRSAAELSADIANYMEGRPLIAGPRTFWYHGRSFVRRFARTFAVLAVVASCVVAALVVSSVSAYVATQARIEAIAQRETARRGEYRAAILAAHGLILQQDSERAAALLASTPSDLRAWEHRYLTSLLPAKALSTIDLPVHISMTQPDTLRLLGERELTFLTRSSGAETEPVRFPSGNLPLTLTRTYDRSGDRSINESLDLSNLLLVDVREKKPLRAAKLPDGTGRPVAAISPDGTRYVAARMDADSVQIRNWADDITLAEVNTSGAVALTENTLLVGTQQVLAFDSKTGTQQGVVVPAPGMRRINRIYAEPGGRFAVLAGESTCELWDLTSKSLRWRCWLTPRHVAFTRDSGHVLLAARSALYVLSTQTAPSLRVVPVAGDAKYVGQIAGTSSESSEIWVSAESRENWLLILPSPAPDNLTPTPVDVQTEGALVLSPTASDVLIMVRDRSRVTCDIKGVRTSFECIGIPAFSADGAAILFVADGQVQERRGERMTKVASLPADLATGALAQRAIVVSPSNDGKQMALLSLGDDERVVHVLAGSTWTRLGSWPVPVEQRETQSRHGALAWSQDGMLAAASGERIALLSPGESGSNAVRFSLEFELSVTHLAFKPGSSMLAAGFTGGGLALIDAAAGKVLKAPVMGSRENSTVGLSWIPGEGPDHASGATKPRAARLVLIQQGTVSIWDEALEVELLRTGCRNLRGGGYMRTLDDVVVLRANGRVEQLSHLGLDADILR
jgi:serine/threonine protein kinase